jgi:hypothetical protein
MGRISRGNQGSQAIFRITNSIGAKNELSMKHPKANLRVHKDVELDIELPKKGDKLDLGLLIQAGLPTVIVATLPVKITKKQVEDLFLYEDGWTVYG